MAAVSERVQLGLLGKARHTLFVRSRVLCGHLLLLHGSRLRSSETPSGYRSKGGLLSQRALRDAGLRNLTPSA